jgi:hypothetical protein
MGEKYIFVIAIDKYLSNLTAVTIHLPHCLSPLSAQSLPDQIRFQCDYVATVGTCVVTINRVLLI